MKNIAMVLNIDWYLYYIEGISENEIAESITDGHNDWGINAGIIDYDLDKIKLYQFKFPDNVRGSY